MTSTPFIKRLVRTTAMIAATAGALFGGQAAAVLANGPAGGAAYNNLASDYPTIQVYDTAAGRWSTNITTSVTPGVVDTREVFFYAHQTNIDVVPQTIMKSSLSTSGNVTTLDGLVTAVGGASVEGHNTATITNSEAANVRVVPGSVKYYIADDTNKYILQENLPTTNPENFYNGVGVNTGAQEGCWNHARAVKFTIEITAKGVPAAFAQKKVTQVAGPEVYGSTATIAPGDEVGYELYLQNTGTGNGTNSRFVDELDSRQTYVAGSSRFKVKVREMQMINGILQEVIVDQYVPIPDSNIRFENLPNGNQRLTWAYGTRRPITEDGFYLYFRTTFKGNDVFPVGTSTVNNCAVAGFSEVTANSNCVTVSVVRKPANVVSFSLRKEVLNVSLNDGQWHDDQLPAAARPGDTLAYSLMILNTGNTDAQNVNLKDMLPNGIVYVGNAKLYSAANPNGVSVDASGIVTSAGYTLATVKPGTSNYYQLVFQAKLPSECAGTTNLVNTATINWNGAERARDTASAILSCTAGLVVQKDIRDANGALVDNAGFVKEGQTLQYRIVVTNSGNTILRNVRLRDIAPQFTKFIAGSFSIDGQTMQTVSEQALFSDTGIQLTDLQPGMTKTILVSFRVVDCPDLGDTTLVNTANVTAEGVALKSDTATAIVRVNQPHF